MIDTFKAYLDKTNLSENSKSAYLFALRQFTEQYGSVTKKNLTAYKVWLVDHFKPQTVNLRLRGMNCYLESVGKEKWKLSFVKVQQKPFLENVISEADYLYFKKRLKEDGELFWYFVIRFLAATGARVSELIQIKMYTSGSAISTCTPKAVSSAASTFRSPCRQKPLRGLPRRSRTAVSSFSISVDSVSPQGAFRAN